MGFWEPLFFWIFAIGALVSSSAVIVLRSPLYSALALIVDFFFLAGLYVLLSAHLLAIVQVLVYGGAIMVLFLFIIMLLNLREDDGPREQRFNLHHIVAALAALSLFLFIGASVSHLVDREALDAGREQARQAAEAEGDAPVYVQTESRIPGLYMDLNEAALERSYREQVAQWAAGTARPSEGKFREFNPNRPVDVPPDMLAPEPQAGITPGQQGGSFGTVLPVSVLLVNRFVVPFELTAVLLLMAIVGAMIIAKRRVA